MNLFIFNWFQQSEISVLANLADIFTTYTTSLRQIKIEKQIFEWFTCKFEKKQKTNVNYFLRAGWIFTGLTNVSPEFLVSFLTSLKHCSYHRELHGYKLENYAHGKYFLI